MRGREKRVFTILVAMLVMLCGCGGSNTGKKQNTELEESKYQIGMSFDSFVIERWLRDRDAFVMTAEDCGTEVNVQNANGNLEEQISQLEYFIEKKVDVIVVIPVDCNGLSDVIKKARKAGIKVISYDRLLQNVECDLYISFDNEKVGTEMAEAMITAIPQGGNIACICGAKSDNNVEQVMEGFNTAIEDSNLNIGYTANCDNWNADDAPQYVDEALSQVDNLTGIMCGNDDVATQVFKTLAEHKLAGKVVIVGQDANMTACQRIVEGTQTMTVYKTVENMASTAAHFAIELAQNKDITSSKTDSVYYTDNTINNGKIEVPYYSLEPIAVTVNNIDNIIIDSGFHEKSEVYLNVEDTK